MTLRREANVPEVWAGTASGMSVAIPSDHSKASVILALPSVQMTAGQCRAAARLLEEAANALEALGEPA